ncbi:ABC transporter permease [Romboutsia sp.]|uniref:ABC transporter permease n=1 Tax=Romboutsia sp. TaxID=1965302 RepID=UPI003F2F923C
MNILIKSALANLRGHKLRVFVTLIWIIIGITSVILVSSIGNGLKKEVTDSVYKVNPNKTRIYFEPSNSNMEKIEAFLKPFSSSDLDELSFINGVEKIGPTSDTFNLDSKYSGDASFDKKTTYIDVSSFDKDTELKPIYGRNFAYEDEGRNVVVVTSQNAKDLFSKEEDALGKGITIGGKIFEVIGIIDESSIPTKEDKPENNLFNTESYLTSYMPKKAIDKLMNQSYAPQEIYSLDLIVSKGYNLDQVSSDVLNKLQDLYPGIEGSYKVDDPNEMTKELENMISSINKFVTLITAISMFVGGIGVMNIMYVSVIERQREIGIRRAIGAKPKAILFQFLVEAVFITVCGGVLGIIIGFIVTNYASSYLPFKAIPNVSSLIFASTATVLTGIIAGIIPAIKAANLDPIKAIYK